MFALTQNYREISPHCMKFQKIWIYDLRIFHEFWQKKIESQNSILTEDSVWGLLLKAYGLSVFSPLSQLQKLAQDYFEHFRFPVSRRQIQKVFHHLYRLGIQKLGNISRLPFAQIQKRFGKDWCEFFKGVLEPEYTSWRWEPYRQELVLETHQEPDDPLFHIDQIKEICRPILENWSETHPYIGIQKLELQLHAREEEGDRSLEILFDNIPIFKKELSWMIRVLEERLYGISFDSPIHKFDLRVFPKERKQGVQLNLFQDRSTSIEWKELCQKLSTQGFSIFEPELLTSYVPESSWKKSLPLSYTHTNIEAAETRPLIQFTPVKISEPSGKFYFTERLQWFDEEGKEFRRDYYLSFQSHRWVWIFRDQNDNWFEQGIAE